MKWTANSAVTGSVAVVTNESGETGLVDVRWEQTRPQLFGAVYRNRFDSEGNQIHHEGVSVRDIVDSDPSF